MNAEGFLDQINHKKPVGFANYGWDCMEVIGRGGTALRRWLIMGLRARHLGYWMGMPLAETSGYPMFQRLVATRHRKVVPCDVLACDEFRERMPSLAACNAVVWVSMSPPPFPVDQQLKVRDWGDFDLVRRINFPPWTLVLIDAGATGTVLARHWFRRSVRCNILDVKKVWTLDQPSLPEADPASAVA